MKINEINPIEGVQNTKNTKSVKNVKTSQENLSKDIIDIASRDTQFQQVYKKVMNIVNKTPDIRAEKVVSIKQNLDSLKNMSDAKLTLVAEKILADLTYNDS